MGHGIGTHSTVVLIGPLRQHRSDQVNTQRAQAGGCTHWRRRCGLADENRPLKPPLATVMPSSVQVWTATRAPRASVAKVATAVRRIIVGRVQACSAPFASPRRTVARRCQCVGGGPSPPPCAACCAPLLDCTRVLSVHTVTRGYEIRPTTGTHSRVLYRVTGRE